MEQENKQEQEINHFTSDELHVIYETVLRESTQHAGFYFKDFGAQLGSEKLRKSMVELKEGLSAISAQRTAHQLNYQWMGRFNHQHSSGFHRDSAHEHSFLILGYEPSKVDSRVSVADYSQLIADKKLSIEVYFEANTEVNIFNKNWDLAPYATELKPFPKENYRLLVLNNSKSFKEATFGVFHRGEVLQKSEQEDRILNSIMLYRADKGTAEQFNEEAVSDFITTDVVHR